MMAATSDSRSIRIEIDGVKVQLEVGSASPVPVSEWCPVGEWLFFSPLETKIVLLLFDHPALSREEIATRLEEAADGRLRGVLSTLVARLVLRVTSDGYALAVPMEDREEAKRWLERRLRGEENPKPD